MLKRRKGEIATLLTLGLVVVGTLITLGTSLFVNNQKNIASNPRAANSCVKCTCTGTYSGNSCWTKAGKYWKTAGCPLEEDGYGNVCLKPGSGGAVADKCGNKGGKCVDYQDCSVKVGDNSVQKYCSSQNPRDVCCKTSTTSQDNSDETNNTDENGIPGKGKDCCFKKNGVIRVYATYEARVANEMTSDCSENNVQKSYGADGPAFYCPGGTQDYQPIEEYERINNPGPERGKKGGLCYTPYSTSEMTSYFTCDKSLTCSRNDSKGICEERKITCNKPGFVCAIKSGSNDQSCEAKNTSTVNYKYNSTFSCNSFSKVCCEKITTPETELTCEEIKCTTGDLQQSYAKGTFESLNGTLNKFYKSLDICKKDTNGTDQTASTDQGKIIDEVCGNDNSGIPNTNEEADNLCKGYGQNAYCDMAWDGYQCSDNGKPIPNSIVCYGGGLNIFERDRKCCYIPSSSENTSNESAADEHFINTEVVSTYIDLDSQSCAIINNLATCDDKL